MNLASRCLSLVLAAACSAASAAPPRSVGVMTFADTDTLVLADWRAGRLQAVTLPPAPKGSPGPFNLQDVAAPIARALHTRADRLRFEDMAFRPGTSVAYVTLSVSRGTGAPTPALVAVDATGRVRPVDLATARSRTQRIDDVPAADQRLWRDIPAATFTVTDMVHRDGKLYVAGLSSASFASTLRVFDFPFQGHATASSIEMYHPVHNQVETRAPIRRMVIATLNGEPTLVAAFTCSPLVTIPLKDLRDGAHIAAKTVAEFGWGSAPVSMVAFEGKAGPQVLLTHSHKSADLLSVADLATAAAAPGLDKPIRWPAEPLLGVRSTYVPISGVLRLAEQDRDFLAALRRDEATGAMQLVSMRKGLFLRLSDFVNEYDFADFRYGPEDGWRGVHGMLRTDEGFADLAPKSP